MPGSSWNSLAIFILCICQVVTEVSTQTALDYANSPGDSQENVTKKAEDQLYEEGPLSDIPKNIFQDLIFPAASNHLHKLDEGAQYSGQKTRKVAEGGAAVVDAKQGDTETHKKTLSEVSRHRHKMDTRSHKEPVTPQSVTPSSKALSKKLFGVPETRQRTENTKNISSFTATARPDMSTVVFGINNKTWQTNVSEDNSQPGHKDLNPNSINETVAMLDNNTFSRLAPLLPRQLPQTEILATSKKDKTKLKKASYFKQTRRPVTKNTAPDGGTLSRQHKLGMDSHVQLPLFRYSVIKDDVSVKSQSPPSAELGASAQSVTSAQLVTSAEPVTSAQQITSTLPRSSAQPEINTDLAEARTEVNGKLPHEDADEEESNETSTCTTCSKSALTEDQVKAIRLQMFEELLAQKLRINLQDRDTEGAVNDGRATVNPPKLPPAIVEQTIKDNVNEQEKDQFYARDQEIIIAGEDLGRDCLMSEVTGCYKFDLKNKVKLKVAEAQLWFYKLKDVNDVKGQEFRVLHLSGSNSQQQVIATEQSSVQEGWVKMNITGELHKWLDTGRNNHVLAITCSTCKAKSYTSLFGVKQGYKPLLVMKYSTRNKLTRSKRSQPCDPVSECCKRDLVVNFHEISMVEIYEPRNLSIGYCYGNCNEVHQFTYNHTALKNRLRLSSSYSSQATMSEQLKPCCVPLVLKDTFIMATEGGDYVRKIVPKVIVETCGCM